ncbi:hypothetical protein CONCODRAFT_3814, partial [Conidiobolus coronatus NRRL 28638]
AEDSGITVDQLNEWNKNTWKWHGCDPPYPFPEQKVWVSAGNPPVPDSNPKDGPGYNKEYLNEGSNTLSSNYNTASSIDSRRKTSISSSRPNLKVFSSKSKQDANSSNTNLSAHYTQTPSKIIRKSFAEHRTELDELQTGMVELKMQLTMKKQSELELSERQIKVLNHRILEVESNEISLQDQLAQALKFSLVSVTQANISSSPLNSLEPNHYLSSPHSNGYSNDHHHDYPESEKLDSTLRKITGKGKA